MHIIMKTKQFPADYLARLGHRPYWNSHWTFSILCLEQDGIALVLCINSRSFWSLILSPEFSHHEISPITQQAAAVRWKTHIAFHPTTSHSLSQFLFICSLSLSLVLSLSLKLGRVLMLLLACLAPLLALLLFFPNPECNEIFLGAFHLS